MKKLFDYTIALPGLLAAAPVILILIFLIRRDSAGPGLFIQDRVGQNGKIFRCMKLRTMRTDAPNVPTHEAAASQVTSIGHFLRRTKLDELPQLWNILRGEMSFVGPRPCLPTQTVLIEERRKRGVLTLVPGITGLAQVNHIDMSDPVKLAEKDAEYMRGRTFWTDLKLIYLTMFAGAGQGDRTQKGI